MAFRTDSTTRSRDLPPDDSPGYTHCDSVDAHHMVGKTPK